MDDAIFSQVVLNSDARKNEARTYENKRYLFEEVMATPKEYYAGIRGLRGIGKTILLLQMANEMNASLYFSADATNLRQEGLYEILRHARSKGYKNIFIDEIYHKNDWQQDLKTSYDETGLRIFFTGSSALEITGSADLSRRAILFDLKPLSFREYLVIKKKVGGLGLITDRALFDWKERNARISATARFNDYLAEYYRVGGLLYQSDEIQYFYRALENTIDKIIQNDLAYLREIDTKIENDVYKILEWIAITPVGETNYSTLASKVAVSKPTVIRIIDDLVRIGIIKRVLPCGKESIRKEPKLYLAFPFREFFCATLLRRADVGSLREEFFINHVGKTCYLKGKRGEKTSDFLFEGKKLEVGGKGKGFGQNPDFVVRDSISLEKNAIPLYLMGFLY